MSQFDAMGSGRDPYVYVNDGSHIEYRNIAGRTRFDPRLAIGERTAVFLVAGQSNGSNYVSGVDSHYTPVSSKVQNMLFTDGGIYDARDPMLGNDNAGGSWLGRLGDRLVSAGTYDRVIFIPVAVGGSSVLSWLPPSGKDSEYLYVAFRRAAAVGLDVTAVLWQQGEADNAYGMETSTYAGHLNAVIAGVRSEGWVAPWLLAKSTWYLGSPSAAIRDGIDAVINVDDILAGPDTDILDNTFRAVDQTHFLASGADAAAQLWSAAIQAAALPGIQI